MNHWPLGNERERDSRVGHGVFHNEVVGEAAIDALVGRLTEDAGDVGLLQELAVKLLLGALVTETAIAANRCVCAKDEGATNGNTGSIALKDHRSFRMRVGDLGVVPRPVSGRGDKSKALDLEGISRTRGGDEHLVNRKDIEAVGIKPVAGEPVEAVLSGIGTREVDNEEVALRGVCGKLVRRGEAIGVVAEELEITSLHRCRRAVAAAEDVESCGWVGDRRPKVGLGIHGGTNCTEAVVIERVKLADNVAVHIDVSTRENRVLVAANTSQVKSLTVICGVFQGDKSLAKADHNEAVDLVGADLVDHSRASAKGFKALTAADDGVHGNGVGALEEIAGTLSVGEGGIIHSTGLDEHHLKTLGLLAAKPLAQLLGDAGFQFADKSGLILGAEVVGRSVTEVIHLKGEGTDAEGLGVISNDFVTLNAVPVETAHGAEGDGLTGTLGEVGDGLDWGIGAGTLKLTEIIFGLFGDFYSLLPQFRQKVGALGDQLTAQVSITGYAVCGHGSVFLELPPPCACIRLRQSPVG